jgi:hypothetical protein
MATSRRYVEPGKDMTISTPTAIQRFVEATNNGDSSAFLDAFSSDAFLSDWGRTFTGRNEISRWNQTDNIGVEAKFHIVSIEEVDETYRVRIAVKSNGFNGEGTMTFTLDGDHISRLIIS